MSNTEQEIRRYPFFLSPQSSVLITLCLLGLLLSLSVHAQENGNAPPKLNPYTGNAEAIAEGQQLYKELNCYGCHGMRGGGGMGPNLTDETWQTGDGSDASLLAQIREGKGKMPAFKDVITDDQAWKIIAFVRSLYKGDPETVKW
ncbi:MAG TPA: cytochrome c [Candidatus Binatia bacterium]|nr:cytochrome c [Candidatus Binatia bacterium]